MRADLRTAMSSRDTELVLTLRSLLAAIDNATANGAADSEPATFGFGPEPVGRSLDEEDVAGILSAERLEIEEAVSVLRSAGASQQAEAVSRRIEIVERYL